MKRDPALVTLSRDHHRALEAALALRRATVDDLGEAVERFREFWTHHVQRRHFEVEEELLLPALAGDEQWDAMAERVRREHQQIRAQAETVTTVADAHALGELLNDHVRFEERDQFPLLEARLDPIELEQLGREISAATG